MSVELTVTNQVEEFDLERSIRKSSEGRVCSFEGTWREKRERE